MAYVSADEFQSLLGQANDNWKKYQVQDRKRKKYEQAKQSAFSQINKLKITEKDKAFARKAYESGKDPSKFLNTALYAKAAKKQADYDNSPVNMLTNTVKESGRILKSLTIDPIVDSAVTAGQQIYVGGKTRLNGAGAANSKALKPLLKQYEDDYKRGKITKAQFENQRKKILAYGAKTDAAVKKAEKATGVKFDQNKGAVATLETVVNLAGAGALAKGSYKGSEKIFTYFVNKVKRGEALSDTEEKLLTQVTAQTDKTRLLGAGDTTVPKNRRLKSPTGMPEQYLATTDRNARMTAGANPGTLSKDINPLTRSQQPPKNTLVELNNINKKLRDAQLNGGLSAQEARSLIAQRKALIDKLDGVSNPAITKAEQNVANVEAKIAKEDVLNTPGSKTDVPVNEPQITTQPITQPVVPTEIKQAEPLINATKPAGSALKLQQQAVEKGIKEDFGQVAGYAEGSYKLEAQKAVQLVQDDPIHAMNVAMGRAAGDNPIHAVAVKNAVKETAIANKDFKTLQELANSPLQTQTSQAAQVLGAEGYTTYGASDPVKALTELKNARMNAIAKRAKSKPEKMVETTKKQIRQSKRPLEARNWDAFVKSLQC